MNEDVFNTSLRGFLKKVGITSQREIEKAVRDAVAGGKLKGNEKLPAKMTLTSAGSASPMRYRARLSWAEERATFFPSPLVGEGGEMRSISTGEGLSPRIQTPLRIETPHPALRATFSHKGRRRRESVHIFWKENHMDIKVRDSNGALLAEGDTVTLIKDLKLKGSSTVLKRGTVIRNIHLTDNERWDAVDAGSVRRFVPDEAL